MYKMLNNLNILNLKMQTQQMKRFYIKNIFTKINNFTNY